MRSNFYANLTCQANSGRAKTEYNAHNCFVIKNSNTGLELLNLIISEDCLVVYLKIYIHMSMHVINNPSYLIALYFVIFQMRRDAMAETRKQEAHFLGPRMKIN